MQRRARPATAALAIHYRPFMGRIAVFALVAAALWLIASGKNPTSFTHTLRKDIADTLAPVVSTLAKPVDSAAAFAAWVRELSAMQEENRALKEENMRLKQEYSAALQIRDENARLRALLKFAPSGKEAYTSARVAVDSANPYSRSVIITTGSANGVQEDAAVVNDKGMVGRIVEAGKKTSRVLLLTDINSRIPVMSERSREHAVAAGDNSDALTLLYLPENSKLQAGERIVTSGDGALIPPGLPIGMVVKVEKGVATVKPFSDRYRLDYVSVIDF